MGTRRKRLGHDRSPCKAPGSANRRHEERASDRGQSTWRSGFDPSRGSGGSLPAGADSNGPRPAMQDRRSPDLLIGPVAARPPPPNVSIQANAPALVSFIRKTSVVPIAVLLFVDTLLGSKSTVPTKYPVTYTLPETSTLIAYAASLSVDPWAFTQVKAPVEEYFP